MIETLAGLLSRHQDAVQLIRRLQNVRKCDAIPSPPAPKDLRTSGERIWDAKLRVREVWRQMKMREDLSESN
ncbi:MAG: hypothetical protein K2W95_08900 [Candidatus Obscuribacterales bacterium]|nr:hypothetical protein [Candidatus Obscuribacterales bacterium]